MTETTELIIGKSIFSEQKFKTVTVIFIALLFFILPIASLKVGIPGDEPIDAQYGKEALKFYSSFGKDKSFISFSALNNQTFPYQKYYGALFEASSVKFADIFRTPLYPTRHVLIALCGAVIILFTALFTAELAGWLAALVAVLLLASSPTFIGHSFFNSKDIPMAMGFIISFYFFVKLLKNLPVFSIGTIIGCITGIAVTVGIRIGGLLLLSFLVVFLLYFLSDRDEIRKQLFSSAKNILKFVSVIFLISVTGSLLGFLCYPNFFVTGFSHITEALAIANNFPVKIWMLFKGELINSSVIPRDYLLVFMGITFPLTVIAGLIIYFVFQIAEYKKFTWQNFILIYSILFLFLYVSITRQFIYNGWRHVLFIYPIMISAAAIGYKQIYFFLKNAASRLTLIVLFSVMFGRIFLWMYTNHPYEYIYFNEIIGGVKGAYGNYDTDYQQLAASASYDWLKNSPIYKTDTAKNKILLTNNIALMCMKQNKGDSVTPVESSFLYMNLRPMNYGIYSTIFLDKEMINNFFPPKGVIHTEQVDGVPLSVVIKRENDFLVKGKFYFDNTQLDSAFYYLQKAFEYDNNDFRLWPTLAHCYYLKGYPSHAMEMCSQYLHFFPEDTFALNEAAKIQIAIEESKKQK